MDKVYTAALKMSNHRHAGRRSRCLAELGYRFTRGYLHATAACVANHPLRAVPSL